VKVVLHFGVVEFPYSWVQGKGKRAVKRSRTTTTGDVAEILEAKYKIYERFWELHKEEIIDALSEAIQSSLESALMGAPLRNDVYLSATAEIEALFRKFLSERELESKGYPGIPTAAALKGVNHRLKRPYVSSNPRRPSFIDTGVYESAFRAWVTEHAS
jgi:hypothetical protein